MRLHKRSTEQKRGEEANSTAARNLQKGLKLAVTRLDDRCKDLLKARVDTQYGVNTIHHMHVSFLHRTVRDFLRDQYLDALKDKAGEFSPAQSLARVQLSLLKRFPIHAFYSLRSGDTSSRKESLNSHFWLLIKEQKDQLDHEIVDEFDKTIQQRMHEGWIDADWMIYVLDMPSSPLYSTQKLVCLPPSLRLVAWAIYIGLRGYLYHNWQPETLSLFEAYDCNPLRFALEKRYLVRKQSRLEPIFMKHDVATLQFLLQRGCNPNKDEAGLDFLREYVSTLSPQSLDHGFIGDFYDTVDVTYEETKLLVEHGLVLPRYKAEMSWETSYWRFSRSSVRRESMS